jgi:pyruvate carboxylase
MRKLLVANRSEIAIRIFRAANELGIRTVAIYSYEDRFSLHRFKADESYLIGPRKGGEPVKSYLNIDAIVQVAREHGADALHPGYGFLSENADLARACAREGVTFVGPRVEHLETFGDKTAAKRLAKLTGVPTIPGTEKPIADAAEIARAADEIGYPLMVKASFGGGGRGMRVVRKREELAEKLAEAQREAGAAFGRTEVFLERYIASAKHIEVQILGDQHGNLVHLWERDCSVQRRHQKVVEVAPAYSLDPALRQRICDAAVRLCAHIGYVSAGTVEFLVDAESGEFFFIEVNPRVQVEHTVTEVVTGIDIVKSQLLVAQGNRLHEAPLLVPPQNQIAPRGVAIQCRITTEDPENMFIPDYGKIITYRSPGGPGLRLDGGNGFGGAVITPYFDSLLVKVTAFGADADESCRRMDRGLREFRIRGVKTNIPFLENLINHATFRAGSATTRFIDETPELFVLPIKRDRATKALLYLGEVIVNSRPDVKGKVIPGRKMPEPPIPPVGHLPMPRGLRDILLERGAEGFSKWLLEQKQLFFTDTTLRDAHQSLLATRMRTYDMLAIAPAIARIEAGVFSLEMWGGATFDTAMRFLQEDPWARLIRLREKIPNIPFQMLLRASNAVGYSNYPDNVVREFIKAAATHGIDVFRIFDSLNWTENMRVAMDAVRENTRSVVEAAICYTGDILDKRRPRYNVAYYTRMARQLEKMGAHIICIKDMAGLCKPYAAYELVRALKQEVGLPIHFHTHDTSGVNAASILRAADAGASIADVAIASMSGTTSQPNFNSVVAALRNTERQSDLDLEQLNLLSDYWEAVREQYYPFEEAIKAGTADVYKHEMPGGQYTNLRQQARSLHLEQRWNDVAAAYAEVNELFGDIVKVTPSSKVVGDMALFMVTNNLTARDILESKRPFNYPKSVVEMMQGYLGHPEGGWPEQIRQLILNSSGAKPIEGRPGESLPAVDFATVRQELAKKIDQEPTELDVMSYLMYPDVFVDFEKHRQQYEDVTYLPTPAFFYGLEPAEEINVEIEPGKTLVIRYLAMGETREDGMRTVFFELNGEPRTVDVLDRSVEKTIHRHVKATPDDPNHVPAPMPGKVSSVVVSKGQKVRSGDRLLTIEAMKMETAVYSPKDGTVREIHVHPGSVVASRDLLIALE